MICDNTMPELNGNELRAEIQLNRAELCNIPFIFLTAIADKENRVTGLQAGAADYLTKPVDHDILLAKIAGCVTPIENDKKAGGAF